MENREPRLPLDVINHILRHSDVATRKAMMRVSRAYFHEACAYLYYSSSLRIPRSMSETTAYNLLDSGIEFLLLRGWAIRELDLTVLSSLGRRGSVQVASLLERMLTALVSLSNVTRLSVRLWYHQDIIMPGLSRLCHFPRLRRFETLSRAKGLGPFWDAHRRTVTQLAILDDSPVPFTSPGLALERLDVVSVVHVPLLHHNPVSDLRVSRVSLVRWADSRRLASSILLSTVPLRALHLGLIDDPHVWQPSADPLIHIFRHIPHLHTLKITNGKQFMRFMDQQRQVLDALVSIRELQELEWGGTMVYHEASFFEACRQECAALERLTVTWPGEDGVVPMISYERRHSAWDVTKMVRMSPKDTEWRLNNMRLS